MRQKNNFLQSVTLRTKLMASSKNIQQCIFTNLMQTKISFFNIGSVVVKYDNQENWVDVIGFLKGNNGCN